MRRGQGLDDSICAKSIRWPPGVLETRSDSLSGEWTDDLLVLPRYIDGLRPWAADAGVLPCEQA
jgi:hypothetical protein